MSIDYYDDNSYPAFHPVDFSAWMGACLSVNGYNTMRTAYKGILGTAQSPSYSYLQDTRSGHFSSGAGVNGVSSYGFLCAQFYNQDSGCMDIIDRNGVKATLSTLGLTASRIVTVPDLSGALIVASNYITYAVGSTTNLKAVGGLWGRLLLVDRQGGYVEINYRDSGALTLINSSSDYSLTLTPAASQVGISLVSGNIQVIVGTTLARDIRMVCL